MSDDSVPQNAQADPLPPEAADPSPPGEVELYWSKPPAAVRRDPAHPPHATGGPHLRPDASPDPGNVAGLWIDLGGGD